MKRLLQFLGPLLLPLAAAAASLGVNIDLPERGGTYIDVIQEGWRWARLKGGAELKPADFGPHGWPIVDAAYIFDWRPVAEWSGQVDDPEGYRPDTSGVYKGSFQGRAEVRPGGEGRIEGLRFAGGRSTFDLVVPKGSKGFFTLEFTRLQGFSDLQLWRPGYADADAVFHRPLLEALAGLGVSAIRYMNFTRTNAADPQPGAVLEWGQDAHPGGRRWDRVLQLANRTKTDPWINVPLSASPGYVAALAKLFARGLDPGLKLYVESSNEVWNTAPGFPQSRYNQAQAKRLGLGEHENHARRTLELARAFEAAFGKGSLNRRVRVVLASHQPMLEWWVEPMLQSLRRQGAEPKAVLWGIAGQTYFGARQALDGGPEGILAACRRDIDAQLDEATGNRAGRRQWALKAQAWGLPGGYLSYEGGPDHGGGATAHVADRIQAERSPAMGALMRHNLDQGFARLGGSLAMQFTLSSAYNRYGCWGLTDDITVPRRNAKYAALAALASGWQGGR